MKKNKFSFVYVFLPVFALLISALVSFKGTKHSLSLSPTSIKENSIKVCQSCPPCSSSDISCCCDWFIPNAGFTKLGGVVTISTLAQCNNVTATPAWYTNHQIGTVISTWRPSATRVFTATGGGATFQCTVYTTGAFWVVQTGGATLGRGVSINGSYSL